jgi:hypothetical protein
VAGSGVVVPRDLRAWDGILILTVLGSLGRVFRALGSFLEAEAGTGVEDGVGASAKSGVSLAVMEVVEVGIAGDFKAIFLPVERAILDL